MSKDVYYIATDEKQKADLEDFRARWIAHQKAVKALAIKLGATSWQVGFGGSLVAAGFKGDPPAAFSKRQNRHGCYGVLSRGRSDEQKAAIAALEEENKAIRAMVPSANKLAEAHGFITSVSFKPADGGQYPQGNFAIGGHRWEMVQPIWQDDESPIFVVGGCFDEAVASAKYGHDVELVFDPPSFPCPDGYERISEARYKFLTAEYALAKEEAS